MALKTELLSIIRQLGISNLADQARFHVMRIRNSRRNRKFRNEFPGIPLPPPYMVYESFQIDYRKYYLGGREDAEWITSLARPYSTLEHIRILDWGCGPARIIRHLPALLGNTNSYFGTDYNAETIAWCSQHIKGIPFCTNGLTPPLSFVNDYFNFIYGISILTHLSEENHYKWSDELYRVLAPDGILLLTSHGDAFLEKLTPAEIDAYRRKKPVSRDKTKEGHRTFGTFQPPAFLRDVFTQSGFSVVGHLPGQKVHMTYISQDVWLLKK